LIPLPPSEIQEGDNNNQPEKKYKMLGWLSEVPKWGVML